MVGSLYTSIDSRYLASAGLYTRPTLVHSSFLPIQDLPTSIWWWIWEFGKHVERVLHASGVSATKYFTSFRGQQIVMLCDHVRAFLCHRKGQKEDPCLENTPLCNLSQHQDLLSSFFFPSSFCACVGPTVLFLWQIFLTFWPKNSFQPRKSFDLIQWIF